MSPSPHPSQLRAGSPRLTLVVDNSRAGEEQSSVDPESRVVSWVHSAWSPRRRAVLAEDRGAVTAEYVLVIMAGVALAGVLVAVMRSGEIRQMLVDLVQSALGSAG